MKKASFLVAMFLMLSLTPITVSATSLDELQQQAIEQDQEVEQIEDGLIEDTDTEVTTLNDNALVDYMRGYQPITEENMQFANATMSPVVKVIGNVSGCVMIFAIAAIFFTTALDLLYIAFPPIRAILNPTMGMPERGLRRKWVSDEVCRVVNIYGNAQQGPMMQGGMGMGMPSGMGMGMGMPMQGGMSMGMPQQQPQPMKIVIFEYLKARAIFLVIFAIASTLLLSSIFTDCGINVAELIVKLMNKVNESINNVNM